MEGVEVSKNKHFRDLGVTACNSVAFQDHISNIARKFERNWDESYVHSQHETGQLCYSMENSSDPNLRLQ